MSAVQAVRDLEFPRTFDELRAEAGKREVNTAKGNVYPLEEVLDVVESRVRPDKDPLLGDGSVPSLPDFQGIVQRHWEAVRFHNVPAEQRPERGGAQPQDPRTHA